MKKLLKSIACVAPIAITLTACNSVMPAKPTPPVTAPTEIKETYPALPPAKDMLRLKEGQTIKADGTPISVTFDKVVSDDRCPLNTKCIWAGNATTALTITDKDGKTQSLQLSSGDLRGDLKRKASVFGHDISLETVYPTPNTATSVQDLRGHYLIDVKVVPSAK